MKQVADHNIFACESKCLSFQSSEIKIEIKMRILAMARSDLISSSLLSISVTLPERGPNIIGDSPFEITITLR